MICLAHVGNVDKGCQNRFWNSGLVGKSSAMVAISSTIWHGCYARSRWCCCRPRLAAHSADASLSEPATGYSRWYKSIRNRHIDIHAADKRRTSFESCKIIPVYWILLESNKQEAFFTHFFLWIIEKCWFLSQCMMSTWGNQTHQSVFWSDKDCAAG